jgi:hypothetical protein
MTTRDECIEAEVTKSDETKYCNRCCEFKPIEDFPMDKYCCHQCICIMDEIVTSHHQTQDHKIKCHDINCECNKEPECQTYGQSRKPCFKSNARLCQLCGFGPSILHINRQLSTTYNIPDNSCIWYYCTSCITKRDFYRLHGKHQKLKLKANRRFKAKVNTKARIAIAAMKITERERSYL